MCFFFTETTNKKSIKYLYLIFCDFILGQMRILENMF